MGDNDNKKESESTVKAEQNEQKNVEGGRVQKRKRYDVKPERASRRDERRDLMVKAKALWEALRPKATGKEKSLKLVGELVAILQGRIVEFVFRHDGSRIVQWMLAEGSATHRDAVLKELEKDAAKSILPGEAPFFVRLASDRYGKHLAVKLLRVGDRARRIQAYDTHLRGNVTALMRSAPGADALDVAFQTVVTGAQRAALVIELLFSRESRLYATACSKLAQKDTRATFEEYVSSLGPEFRKQVLDAAQKSLAVLADRDALLRTNIVHCALQQYLASVGDDVTRTREMAGLLAPVLVHLTHTRAGAHVAVTCIKVLDAKHRKKAARSLKGHVRKIAEDEFGYRVLIALLEWVDDTRLTRSCVLKEIISASKLSAHLGDEDARTDAKSTAVPDAVDVKYLVSLCKHKHARMVMLHLLLYKQTRYFNPEAYGHLWSVPEEKYGVTSKKKAAVRVSELLETTRGALNKVLESHMKTLLSSHLSAPVVIGAVQDDTMRDVTALAIAELLKEDESRAQLAGNICARKTLATLFKIGGAQFANKVIEVCGGNLAVQLALDRNCIGCAKFLLMATENSEAALAVSRAKSDIKRAVAGNEKSQAIAVELVKRAKMLGSFDLAIDRKA